MRNVSHHPSLETKPKASARDVARFALHYWRQKKAYGLGAVAFMTASVVTDAAVPVFTGRMVDALTGPMPSLNAAWAAFAVFTALAAGQFLCRAGAFACWNCFAAWNLFNIVTDGMRKVQRFSAEWHANAFAGATVRKVTRGMWAFDVFEDTLLIGLLPVAVILAAVTVTLMTKLPLVGASALAVIALYCAVSIWMSLKILAPRYHHSAEHDTRMGATLADIVTGNPTVKSFGAEAREESLFEDSARAWRRVSLNAWQTGTAAEIVRSALRVLMNAVVIALSLKLWHAGKATPGDVVFVVTTFFIISGYLRDIGTHIAHLQRSVSDMEDIVLFWLREDEVADAPDAAALTVARTDRRDMIVFDRVGFSYPRGGREVYRDFSATIASGERVALVGPSGSGKSTFVKLLQRLYNVTSGEIRIDGQNIAGVTLESLRRAVALVPQDPILFHRSLADNIAYGRPGATRDEIVVAAKKAFAHDFISTLPLGYDTLVGERGVKLSGGERQRVAIARALLTDAPILVMDEATSSLDSISEDYIQRGLRALMAGRTTITIAHRLSTVQQADRILVFDAGRIVEEGTHRSLTADPQSYYKKLYDMQVSGLMDDESHARRA